MRVAGSQTDLYEEERVHLRRIHSCRDAVRYYSGLELSWWEDPADQQQLRSNLVGVAFRLLGQQADRIAELRKLKKSSKKVKVTMSKRVKKSSK